MTSSDDTEFVILKAKMAAFVLGFSALHFAALRCSACRLLGAGRSHSCFAPEAQSRKFGSRCFASLQQLSPYVFSLCESHIFGGVAGT